MGEVYRARDLKLGRDVAIKILPAAFAGNPDRVARFEREARVLASLNHPNIAAIYGFEQSGDLRFLVLEYVPGQTLAQMIASGPLDAETWPQICGQVSHALEAAHEKGIVHRDLKPANIKVTPEGNVKVLDFGLAKALADEQPSADPAQSPTLSDIATRAGLILGTAPYMSPEQARGRPLDKRTDIWSFGCVLYEMLTRKQPFGGASVSDVIAAVLRTEPDWNALPADTPAGVRLLLRRCLQKDAAQRLRDIGDARILLDEPLETPHPPTPIPKPRRRVLAWSLGALLLTALAGLGVWRMARPPAGDRAVARFAVPLSPPLAVGAGPALAISPDGGRLVYVGGREKPQLYLRSVNEMDAKPLAGTEGAVNPFFSPDGEWVAYVVGEKLYKVAVAGGAPAPLWDVDTNTSGAWAADGAIVFSGGLNSGLFTVASAGGAPRALTKVRQGENLHQLPEILHGGQSVLFTVWPGSAERSSIAALSLRSGERKTVVERGLQGRYARSGHLVFFREGNLLAAPFDAGRLEVTGPAVQVVDGVIGANAGGHFALAASGTLLYVPGRRERQLLKLVWVDRRGAVTPFPMPPRFYGTPQVSRDGQRIVFSIREANVDVWAYEMPRGVLTRLTFEEGEDETPLLSPDGKRVAYSSTRPGKPRSVFWRLADSTGGEELLWTSEHHIHLSSWSSDGRTLAFSESHPQTKWDIWLLSLEGERKARPFLQTAANESTASLSPDGRWIAYASDETGRGEIYVRSLSDSGGKWQITTEGAVAPVWAVNGRELFYRQGRKWMSVAIQSGPTFAAGPARFVFEGEYSGGTFVNADYAVAPDGRFLMIDARQPEQAPAQLNVVLNWFEELKRRVPAK